MRAELATAGFGLDQVVFVGVNDKAAAAAQTLLTDACTFPTFQDTDDVDAWGQHGGKKDDMVIYDASGALYAWLPLGGDVDINLSVQANYDAVKALIVEAIQAP